MAIGQKLEQLIKEAGRNVNELAAASGVNPQTIYSIIRRDNTKADIDDLSKICCELDVPLDYFSSEDIRSARAKKIDNSPEYLAKYGLMPPPQMKRVPRIGTVACGSPIIALDEYGEYDDVPDDVRCDCTILCKGDSMIGAEIYDGDVVYVRQQEDVENGQIAVVKIDDEATLKRVYKKKDHIILMPENPEYEPIIVSGLELEQFRVFGKVVGLFRRIN